MDPNHYPRRILLCVTGLSAQIVTETLYCLAVRQVPPFLPTEIHLLTTAEGARRATLALLDPEQGHFHRLCADYGLAADRIRFDADTLHVIPDACGTPLTDIRSLDDNTAAADAITAQVRDLTADPATSAVHASIAGGRKTMGFYLGYALSLFGRPQDRLSHVLVAAPFESHPEFFYPPRKPRVLYTQPPNSQPIHTSEATITLASIPFVRLRDGLDPALHRGTASFSETVRRAQLGLATPELVLDVTTRRIRCSKTIILTLKPVDFAWLAWFARRAQTSQPPIRWTEADAGEFLDEYRQVNDALLAADSPGASDCLRAVKVLATNGMEKDYFEQRNSHLKQALGDALGPAAAALYLPQSHGRRPCTRYGLRLEPQQIRFGLVEETP
jgi:CRISPR-associated protein (TIGR02584 family)